MNNKLVAIGGTLLGLAAGSVAGYFFAKKRLEEEYAEFAHKEIQEAKVYLSMLYKGDSPGDVLQRRVAKRPDGVDDSVHEGPSPQVLERVLDGLRYGKPGVVVKEPPKKNDRNVFEEEEEVEETEDGNPIRILSITEFMAGEKSYNQVTLTYFAEDDVLVDENEMPIEDVDATVGNANMDRFGYKSRDPKVVYIRNDRLQIDYEVVRHEGSYAEQVHGVEQERPRTRKMPRE